MQKSELAATVARIVDRTPVLDVHTHLFSAAFGEHLLWGVDELLNYHYLICETFLNAPRPYDEFWAMPKPRQAEWIWDTLFVQHTPVSEATRGVVTTLRKLGLDLETPSLAAVREFFASMTAEQYVDLVLERANVSRVVMTNDVFDEGEQAVWADLAATCAEGPGGDNRGQERAHGHDDRFLAAMRIDGLLNDWPSAAKRLTAAGYSVGPEINDATAAEVLRFLDFHANRMRPVYMAASLPPDFAYPESSPRGGLVEKCILPFSRERGIPFAMMIGVKKRINPALDLAGDGLGKADIGALERLCERNPDNKFLVTYLSRENQHEFAVTARKFHNLMVFGCWWFLNIPSVIAEMTSERVELLGARFIPQHSDARVLDQLIYKWAHSRKIIGDVLTQKYGDLVDAGWPLKESDIERDVTAMLSGNFASFVGL
jgi:hypothetical protein